MKKNKNHFVFSYKGNKRTEFDYIIKDIDFKNIKYIVEPFCGTSSVSYNLSKLYPNKFTYILNDNDHFLIKLYNILKDESKTKFFKCMLDIVMRNMNKQKYNNLENDIYRYYIHSKIFTIRRGLYPLKEIINYKLNGEIINFLRNEKVKIKCCDANDIYDKYKDKQNAFIFIDPPYIMNTCLGDYSINMNLNIYYHVYKNPIKDNNALIIFCLEKMWVVELLFSDYRFVEYGKKYQGGSKKQTTHIIINNKILNIDDHIIL